MRYNDFERIISQKRLRRYVAACGGNTRKAMTLYRYNVVLAQSMFAIIGYFEVALRNAIDAVLTNLYGNEWLKESVHAQYNHSYIFNELDKINTLRNRIAHHEPICFPTQSEVIYTDYIRNEYQKIKVLLEWMDISYTDFLFGLDHVV